MTAAVNATTADWLLDPVLSPDVHDEAMRPLYEAAGRGELAMPFCAECELALELEQDVCDGCGARNRCWRRVDRRGVVHTATVMHRREPGLVHADSAYPIVDVELSSGHRIVMTTTAPSHTAPPIGSEVRVGFRRLGEAAIPAIDNSEVHL
jgi:uncharacterized OB-fold protein